MDRLIVGGFYEMVGARVKCGGQGGFYWCVDDVVDASHDIKIGGVGV